MEKQGQFDFDRIAEAIDYIKTNFQAQPNLDEVAKKVHLSPAHFQRMFTEWAGTSPKKFLQFISLEHAKSLLKEKQATLFDTTFETGLSSTSRLHDLFVKIEGMTPAEYKNGGKNLKIHYCFDQSIFGPIIIASTSKGICHIAFENDSMVACSNLKNRFPNAQFIEQKETVHQKAISIFQNNSKDLEEMKLHLKGTDFQLKVWESLLKIPTGNLSTYGKIADDLGNPNASRAVGTAIGKNPVAFLIPCHRVIQSTGHFGGYMWGPKRKTAIIGWESAQNQTEF